jgi:hypothetical protein
MIVSAQLCLDSAAAAAGIDPLLHYHRERFEINLDAGPPSICTTLCSFQSVRSSPSPTRRGWPLWRLMLDLATDPVGLAAGLGLFMVTTRQA